VAEYKGKMIGVNFTAPEDLIFDFRRYCEKQRRPLSAQLQFMMIKLLEKSTNQSENSLNVEYKRKSIRINITVPEDLISDFKPYCKKQCRSLSAQLQFMMIKSLEKESAS
jgi:4-alpha-glucanotransferase